MDSVFIRIKYLPYSHYNKLTGVNGPTGVYGPTRHKDCDGKSSSFISCVPGHILFGYCIATAFSYVIKKPTYVYTFLAVGIVSGIARDVVTLRYGIAI